MNPDENKAINWPRAGEPPLKNALLRSQPEDFRVAEQMPFTLDGHGEHLWLKVRKRGHVAVKIQVSLERDVSWSAVLPDLHH